MEVEFIKDKIFRIRDQPLAKWEMHKEMVQRCGNYLKKKNKTSSNLLTICFFYPFFPGKRLFFYLPFGNGKTFNYF